MDEGRKHLNNKYYKLRSEGKYSQIIYNSNKVLYALVYSDVDSIFMSFPSFSEVNLMIDIKSLSQLISILKEIEDTYGSV